MSEKIDQTQAAIIGLLLLYPERIAEVDEAVCEEWFTGYYRKAFVYLVEHGGADPVSAAAAIGLPTEKVNEWIECEFSAIYLPQHIANLEKEGAIRKIRYLGQKLSKTTNPEESFSLIERFNNSFTNKDKTAPIHIKEGLRKLVETMELQRAQEGIMGMTYGIAELDAVTEGMHKGDLVIVAAPSSMGKTAFAIGAMESAAAKGFKALCFSCEMTIDQLLRRSVASHSSVPMGAIRASRLDYGQYKKLHNSIIEMSKWNILMDDPAGISLSELTRKVKTAAKAGIDLVLIDYLQLMKYDKDKENKELDIITTGLKHLAKELNICILCLSQLNRESDKANRKPRMTDLRGSGMIENNADVILFPYREHANCEKCQQKIEDGSHSTQLHQSVAEIVIGKQRQGERNVSVKAVWVGSRVRFIGENEPIMKDDGDIPSWV